MPQTRLQRSKEQEILKGIKDNDPVIVDIEDDDGEKNDDDFNSPLKSTPDKTESDKESTSVAINYHRSPTNKFNEFLKPTKKQAEKRSINMNNTQELSENDDGDDEDTNTSKRYDIPDELKGPKIGLASMLQKPTDTTLSSDSEEENGTTKEINATPSKKPKLSKPQSPIQTQEFIEGSLPTVSTSHQQVDASSPSSTPNKTPAKSSKPSSETEIISIPSCSITEIEDTSPKKYEPKKTTSTEELDKTFDNPVDSKLNRMRERFDEIKGKTQDSLRPLCDEVLLYLHSDWTLMPENKERFKKGLEIAGMTVINNTQKAKLFFLLLSYYIIHEKEHIETCIMYLFEPLSALRSKIPPVEFVDVSVIDFEIEKILKEFSNNMEVSSILRKYQALYLICKLQKQCQQQNDADLQRLDTLKSVVKHQHHCIRSYFKSDKKR